MTHARMFYRTLIAAAIIASGTVLAQDSTFYAWVVDEAGAPQLEALAPGEGYSINRVMGEHFPGVRFMTHLIPQELVEGDPAPSVMFRWLTDEPLVVLTAFPERAVAYVASFDLAAFLGSWRLRFALESAIERGPPVADLEVLTVLGAPTHRLTQTGPLGVTERWEYPRYRLVLYLRQGALDTVVTY